MNDFINIKLTRNNIDKYFIRTAIFSAIKEASSSFSGNFLDVGCGKMPYRSYLLSNSNVQRYVGLDLGTALEYDSNIKPDYTWDGQLMPFEDNSFDCAMATEVLEHCPYPIEVLKEVRRVLRQGGVFFFTVPFLWNLHETPHDEYRYTPFALERMLLEAGFEEIDIRATGGWHASMAQMLGLWLIRSNLPINLHRVLKWLFFPIYKILLKHDKPPLDFTEGSISPSFTGTAKVK
ncbi:MAG: class I SAM-dependent methyltransferase [Flavobacteriaceae bacterium]|nr:class I SAM-dependent methyltransferase [Flavobacteriaceae bacterium]